MGHGCALLAATGGEPGQVSAAVTAGFALLLLGLIVALALEEKLHAKKSVIAGFFAMVCLLAGTWCGILPFEPVVVGSQLVKDNPELHSGGHEVALPVYVPAIDWEVLAIIFGASLFVDVVSRSGLFSWIAIKVTKATRGDPFRLLLAYGVLTVVFSAVLNNVTAMIIVGSLTAVSLEKLGRSDKLLGFLLLEGLLTNVGGLLTLISSVPNIILGSAAGISFVEFLLRSSPFVLVATAGTLLLGAWLFGIRPLADEEQRRQAAEQVAGFDENNDVTSPGFFWFSAAMTALFILTIASASALPLVKDLRMGFVALSFGGVMLLRYKDVADRFYKAIDWDLLGFFAALFVVIYVMEHAQVLHALGRAVQWVVRFDEPGTKDVGVLLVGSAAFSSVTDNIPLAAMLAQILGAAGVPGDSPLWWAVIFGANLGGNLTPIGSASTLVAVTLMHKHQVPMSFGGFVKAALPYAAVQLLVALLYVLIFLS